MKFKLSCWQSVCSCSVDYIGERIYIVNIKWIELDSKIDKSSEYAKPLCELFNLEFPWSLLSITPSKGIL